MNKLDMLKERKPISILYGTLLILAILSCVGALIFIPVDTFMINADTQGVELEPSAVLVQNEDTQELFFHNINWEKYGNCLQFISSHQEIEVRADGEIVFERRSVDTLWGRTPGYSMEYVEVPVDTRVLTVTVTACYPSVRGNSISVYQGYSVEMMQDILRQECPIAIVNFMDFCVGLMLLLYGIAAHKRSNVGGTMVYLGIFMLLLGLWTTSENGISAILMEQRAACSFISYTTLALLGIPFIMFVRYYLETEDKYYHRILIGLNVLNIVLCYSLQLLGIADMKQTLPLTHVILVLSFLYLPASLIHMVRKRYINRRFWLSLASFCLILLPLSGCLYMYYRNFHEADGYADVFFFLFVAIYAVDITRSIMKEIDAGKKAAIYQELAEKDLLTGCSNRNAYRNDAEHWKNLHGVLLATFDLNNLKQCNDTLGHTYGDQYITDSAAILQRIFSKYGKVYRIGGDEFCIIIPDGHKCNIDKLLEAMVEEERIYNAASPVIHMQIASGYAVFDAKTDSNMEDIRIRADKKMYENKKALKQAGHVA